MQSRPALFIPLFACALLGGCAGVSPTRIIGNTLGGAGGALIGHTIGKGNPLATTLGADVEVLLNRVPRLGQ